MLLVAEVYSLELAVEFGPQIFESLVLGVFGEF